MYRVTEAQFILLQSIKALQGKEVRPIEMFELVDGKITRQLFDSTLKRLLELKLLSKVAFGVYTINNYKLSDLEVVKSRSIRKNKKSKTLASQESAPPTVTLTNTANTLADTVSAVLKENADLVALLTKVHETIGNALNLNKGE